MDEPVHRDSWYPLRHYTPARIALGRAGGSLPTQAVLDFRRDHALARDAVRAPFDVAGLAASLQAGGRRTLLLASQAGSREDYLRRPDWGRRLSEASRETLRAHGAGGDVFDLVVLVSDGLAALAAERHAPAVIEALGETLSGEGWKVGPIVLIPFARVKIQDEVGPRLGARYTLMLLGERPGLGVPDSLGAYFTRHPQPACTDADRNCVSNIRAEGLPAREAGRKLARLMLTSKRLGLSGVALKDLEAPTEIQSSDCALPLPALRSLT